MSRGGRAAVYYLKYLRQPDLETEEILMKGSRWVLESQIPSSKTEGWWIVSWVPSRKEKSNGIWRPFYKGEGEVRASSSMSAILPVSLSGQPHYPSGIF